jgi:hypothetical protein
MEIFIDKILANKAIALLDKFELENNLVDNLLILGADPELKKCFLGFIPMQSIGDSDVVFKLDDRKLLHVYPRLTTKGYVFFKWMDQHAIIHSISALNETEYLKLNRVFL